MKYTVIVPKPVQKQLENLIQTERTKIILVLKQIAEDPRPSGIKKLKGYEKTYRVRVGDYRIIYEIKDRELIVLVLSVSHRKDAY
jgi:mRNA interferase RelE/StbE